jgi:hypothetical protein
MKSVGDTWRADCKAGVVEMPNSARYSTFSAIEAT